MAGDTPPKSPRGQNDAPISPPHRNGAPAAPHKKVVGFRRDSDSLARISFEPLHEASPLLLPRQSVEGQFRTKDISPIESEEGDEAWTGQSDNWTGPKGEKSRSTWYLLLLTLGGLG
ncbi:hypothetical protein LTS18_014426, partial [Coniosporium uncinatum]